MSAIAHIKEQITATTIKLTKEETAVLSASIKQAINVLKQELGVNTFKGLDMSFINANPVLRRGFQAREKLFLANQAFVLYKISKKYQGSDLEDAVQLGFISLLRACELYDAETGYAFTTYAGFWLMQALRLATQNNVSSFNAPSKLKILRARLVTFRQKFQDDFGYTPSMAEMAEGCHTTVDSAKKALDIPFEFSVGCVDSLSEKYELTAVIDEVMLGYDGFAHPLDSTACQKIIQKQGSLENLETLLVDEAARWVSSRKN